MLILCGLLLDVEFFGQVQEHFLFYLKLINKDDVLVVFYEFFAVKILVFDVLDTFFLINNVQNPANFVFDNIKNWFLKFFSDNFKVLDLIQNFFIVKVIYSP